MFALRRLLTLTTILLWAFGLSISISQAAPVGPSYPAPGGNLWANTGSVSGANGTAVWDYSNFDTGAFTELYFGLNQVDYGPAGAGLSGTAIPFAFDNASGTVATWTATSDWTNPDTNNTQQVDLRMVLDITGLGSTPWITDLASIGLDNVGSYGILGAVADNTAGQDFTLSWKIEANIGGSWIAINNVQQPSPGGQTQSSFATGFYSVAAVPVPPAILLLGSALFGIGWFGRKKGV